MKVMILEIPSFDSLIENLEGLVETVKDKSTSTVEKVRSKFGACDCEDDWDDEPINNKWICTGHPQPIGIGGKPADENLRFGAAFAIDEPRHQDYDDDDEFLEAREAFDDFVDAGERCVDLGLERPEGVKEHRCNAIRRPIGCPPPMGVDLLGESQFPWWEFDMEDDW